MSSNGLRMRVLVYSTDIVWNELLWICQCNIYFKFITHTHTHVHACTHAQTQTHTHTYTHTLEDHEPTGLKVDMPFYLYFSSVSEVQYDLKCHESSDIPAVFLQISTI